MGGSLAPHRVLIAKVGLDGHDRGAIVLVKALRQQGFEATFSGVRRTPQEIAKMAVERKADCVGLSSHAGAHLTLFPKVVNELRSANWNGGLIIAGGLIPDDDVPVLLHAGISRVFSPEEDVAAIASYIRDQVGTSIARHRAAGR